MFRPRLTEGGEVVAPASREVARLIFVDAAHRYSSDEPTITAKLRIDRAWQVEYR